MGRLAPYVDEFVTTVCRHLAELSGKAPDAHDGDVRREAANLVAALIDADARHTSDELDAYLDDIGPWLDPPLVATAAELQASGLIDGRRAWIDTVSTLYDLLVRADARDGSRRSHDYYDRALRLAHAVAAADLVPSPAEIAAIDAYRSLLLHTLDGADVARPGQPRAATPGSTGADPGPAALEEPAPPARTLEELLAELDALVGLGAVKTEVRTLTSLLRVQRLRADLDLPVVEVSAHLVFTGNPGTGKTTVARLYSQILRAVGVVSKGHLVETDRSHLVAGFVGQTAIRTRELLESGLGGTVLIDEAYALARGGEADFGREAIDTIVKFMEDHRDDLALIAAGYPDEMGELVSANPGLASRFTRTLDFPDYTDDELMAIFAQIAAKHRYELDGGADAAVAAAVRRRIHAEPRGRGFGNARFVRNLFEEAVGRHALRLGSVAHPDARQLVTLTVADVDEPTRPT